MPAWDEFPDADRLARPGGAGELVALYREVVHMPPAELELLRSEGEAWARRLATAPTVPRELRAEQGYAFVPERFREMRAPTLLLEGGDSPPREPHDGQGVAAALADARVVALPGQQHLAMYTAPELFVNEVVRVLGSLPPRSQEETTP